MAVAYECTRCGGKGRLTIFSNVLGGVCFKCRGSGKQAAKPGKPSVKWAVLGTDRTTSLTTAPQVPVSAPVQIVRQVEVPAAVKVFELEGGAGVVVFRQVNGKMVSRFYRAQA